MLKDVVLCKDCAKRPILFEGNEMLPLDFKGALMKSPAGWCPCLCDDPFYSYMPPNNWFCAEGVRKQEETKNE